MKIEAHWISGKETEHLLICKGGTTIATVYTLGDGWETTRGRKFKTAELAKKYIEKVLGVE